MELPIFRVYPQLTACISHVKLGEFPTPVQPLENFGKGRGLSQLYIKRDDRSSPLYGGNKVRKLEFSLADALYRGKKVIVTCGAAGSNHVLATVIHSERLGLKTIALLFDQPNAHYVRRNLLQDLQHGATLVHVPSMFLLPFYFAYYLARGKPEDGFSPAYFLPPGGSNYLTSLGYVNAAFELKEQIKEGQLPEPSYIFITLGTMGTGAGLELGLRLAGLRSRVVGVEVVERWVCNPYLWARMINRTSSFLHVIDHKIPLIRVSPKELIFIPDQIGEGYACFTPQGCEMIEELGEKEGITLEGTYTAKTMAGALQFVKENQLEKMPLLF